MAEGTSKVVHCACGRGRGRWLCSVLYELLGCKRTEYGGGGGGDEVLVVSSRQKLLVSVNKSVML